MQWNLGCVCFGWKWFQEIIFRKIGCLVGLENWIFRKSFSIDCKIVALTTEIHFRSYFHFKWFPELGTRKGRTRERKNARLRSVISREAPFAIDTSRDRAVFFWVCPGFSGFCLFLLLFQLLFQTPENIFRKIFWNATKHMKTFSFPENSISEKWNIFRKCFYTNQTQPKFLYFTSPPPPPPPNLSNIMFGPKNPIKFLKLVQMTQMKLITCPIHWARGPSKVQTQYNKNTHPQLTNIITKKNLYGVDSIHVHCPIFYWGSYHLERQKEELT